MRSLEVDAKAAKAVILPSSTSTRGRPKRIPGQQAVGAGYHIPDSVTKIFMGGWKTHVPLNHLTDAYCMYKHSSALPPNDETVMFDPSTGQVSSVAKPFAADEEERLTFDEWFQAHRRLLLLIKKYLPEELECWQAHFNRILNSEALTEHWALWLLYDIEIRHRSCTESIDPSEYHIAVWNEMELRYVKKAAQTTASKHWSTAPPHSHTTNSRQLAHGNTYVSNSSRHQPSSYPFQRDQGFHPPSHSFRSSNQRPNEYKAMRCIFCGNSSSSHPGRNCSATVNIAGKPCFLNRRNANEPRRDAQGRQYCFAWNGIRGCGPTDCQNGLHACTLCGSRSHSAQRCNNL